LAKQEDRVIDSATGRRGALSGTRGAAPHLRGSNRWKSPQGGTTPFLNRFLSWPEVH